tara:strand:- start:127 stop:621 length:495 start_codon:yes stop_codon:yes gene_type:complete
VSLKLKIAIEKNGKQYYADGDKVFSWLMERYSKYQGRKTSSAVLPYDKRVNSFFDQIVSDGAWLEDMRKAFPGVDIQNELDKAKAWLLSNKSHKKDLKKFCYNWISKATPSFTPNTRTNEDVRKDRKKFSTQRAYKEQYGNEEMADAEDISEIFKNFKLGDSNE